MIRSFMSCVLSVCVLLVTPGESKAITVSDATGRALGELVAMDRGEIALMTPKGYFAHINMDRLGMGRPPHTEGIFYVTPDCTGQAYVRDAPIRPVVVASGREDGPGSRVVYVTAEAVTAMTLEVGETYYEWTSTQQNAQTEICLIQQVYPNSPVNLVPAEPNDHDVTGISNGPFAAPFKLTMRPVFKDGFDGV